MNGIFENMATNSEMIGLKLTPDLLRQLNHKYPDTRMRNNAIRALLQQLVEGKVIVREYRVAIKSAN